VFQEQSADRDKPTENYQNQQAKGTGKPTRKDCLQQAKDTAKYDNGKRGTEKTLKVRKEDDKLLVDQDQHVWKDGHPGIFLASTDDNDNVIHLSHR
jgi:hypothetical protein